VGAVYTVVKNRLFARAAKEVGIELSEPLKGPTAFLFSNDPVSACKVLSGFIKREKRPSVKFGFLENRKVLPEEIVKIAKLPEREVLLSQVLSGLSGPISGLAGVLSGIIRRLIYTIRAVQEKKR
jgi:large subunit ribosomal protein L10